MSLKKRGEVWWTDFTVGGQRFRLSLETGNWQQAEQRQKERMAEAAAGKLAALKQPLARLPLRQAVEQYLCEKLMYQAASSVSRERWAAARLIEHFGEKAVLGKVTPDRLMAYLAARKAAGASNRTVNIELGVFRGMAKRAKIWRRFADEIRQLPTSHTGPGRALSYGEKTRLLHMAASRPEWRFCRLAMILALNTTLRRGEVLGLRWRDVDVLARTVKVRRGTTKTEAGARLIPLNESAMGAVLELRQIAAQIGGGAPDHFLFPWAPGHQLPDPARRALGFTSSWRRLTRAAGLGGLRFHDLRHHAITELAESQAPDSVIRSIAGHVRQEMLEHYSHVRIEAKRQALAALAPQVGAPPPVPTLPPHGLSDAPIASGTKVN